MAGLEMNLYHEVHVSYCFHHVVCECLDAGQPIQGTRSMGGYGRTISRMLTVERLFWVEGCRAGV